MNTTIIQASDVVFTNRNKVGNVVLSSDNIANTLVVNSNTVRPLSVHWMASNGTAVTTTGTGTLILQIYATTIQTSSDYTYDSVNRRLVINTSGVYTFTIQLNYDANTSFDRQVVFTLSTGQIYRQSTKAAQSGPTKLSLTITCYMAAGSFITPTGYQSSGGNLTCGNAVDGQHFIAIKHS